MLPKGHTHLVVSWWLLPIFAYEKWLAITW